MKKPLIYSACLALSVLGLTLNAGAQGSVGYVQAWDNNDPNPPGDGTWDTNTASWTPSGATQGSVVAFTNGNFALFAAGSTVSPTNTITIPGPVTIGGLGIGSVNGVATGATISNLNLTGTGSLVLPSGQWEVNCGGVSGFAAGDQIFVNVPITGTGGLVQRDSGSLYLLASNSYSGGTTITGGQILWYNNSNSFGTGPFTNLGSQSILIAGSPGVVTLTNAFVMNNAGGIMNFGSGQTTLTGPWTLMTSPQIKNNGANTTTVTFAGPISGAFGVFYQAPNGGKIVLSGSNTYTGASYVGNTTGTGPHTVSVSSINSVANPPQQASSSLGKPSSVAAGTISIGVSNSPGALIYTGAGETSDRVINLAGGTGGATIQMDGTGPLVLTSSFTVSSNGAKTLTLQGSSTATNTIMGVIPNSGSGATILSKAGTGTWVLTGTNTYTGGTTNGAGTLIVNAIADSPGASSIGISGTLTMGSSATSTGEVLNYIGTSNITTSRSVVINGSTTTLAVFNLGGQTLTLGGVVSGAGTPEVTNGTLILNGNNTYAGRTQVDSGATFMVGGAGKLGSGNYNHTCVVNGTFIYNSSSAQTNTGNFTGSGGFIQEGSGTVTLSATSTLTGPVTIGSGSTLIVSTNNNVPDYFPSANYAGNFTNNGSFVFGITNAQTISGPFTGTGSVTVNGSGALTLGNSSYTGATTIAPGSTLILNGTSSFASTSSLSIGTGGLLDVSALGLPTLNVNTTSLTASGSSTAAASINGAASSAVNLGSQPISLTFAPTSFTGDSTHPALILPQSSLTLSGNLVTVNNAGGSPLGVGNYTLIQPANGTTGTVNPNVAVTGAGIQGGLYALVQITGGNVVLSVLQPANVGPTWNGNDYATSHNWGHGQNWAGGVPPDATGDQVIFANTAPQSPVLDSSYSVYSLTFNPGTASDNLVASGGSILGVGAGLTNSSGNPQTLALPVNLVQLGSPNVASQWDVTGGNITATGVISDSGTGLSVSGGNTLTLSGANTFTGGTTVNASTLSVNSISDGPSAVGPSGTLTLSNGATLSFTGVSGTTARTLTTGMGTATDIINIPSGSQLSFAQVHNNGDSAAQMLTLTGGGTLTLAGTVDNNGLTMAISQGKVVITKASTPTVHGLGAGTTTVGTGSGGNSAGLQLAGTGNNALYSGALITVSSPDGYLDLNGQSDSFSTLTLSGAGPSSTGALINSASSTLASITNSGGAVILAGDTMIGGPGNIRLASAVNGTNVSLTYAGGATLTLAAVGNYNNGTTVTSGGTLQVTAGSTTLNSGAGSGTITLNGNAILNLSMTNTTMNPPISGGSSSAVDIFMGVGNLWLSNAPASQLNNFAGTYDVNTTATNGGQLVIGAATQIMTINPSSIWRIRAGAVVDFNVGQSNPGTVYLYGAPYTGATLGSLRLDDSVQSGNVILMGDSQIGNGSAVGPSTISGIISGGFGFTKVSPNPVVLTATNTYTGKTAINVGALTLTGTGSIDTSSNISIAAGATFDVSGLASSTYTLSASNTLSATGTASAAATINGASGGTVSLASQPISLTYTPTSTNGDASHPSLNVAQATLQLNNNVITVNNASAQPLGLGTYTIIQDVPGLITGTPNATPVVTGTGLAAGTAGSISVSGGAVNLVVSTNVVPNPPTISSVVKSGSNFIFGGTNGPANGTYVVLTSTNVSTHLNLWTPVSTNTFSPTGAFSVTNSITNSRSFFVIQIP